MKNKFKVGDCVIVTNEKLHNYNKVFKITREEEDNEYYDVDTDDGSYWFHKSSLELFSKEETKSEDNKVKNANVSHYDLWKDFEVIDLIKNTLTKEEYIGALKFNILKYKLRSKGQDEADNIKIQDYTRELNSILEAK